MAKATKKKTGKKKSATKAPKRTSKTTQPSASVSPEPEVTPEVTPEATTPEAKTPKTADELRAQAARARARAQAIENAALELENPEMAGLVANLKKAEKKLNSFKRLFPQREKAIRTALEYVEDLRTGFYKRDKETRERTDERLLFTTGPQKGQIRRGLNDLQEDHKKAVAAVAAAQAEIDVARADLKSEG